LIVFPFPLTLPSMASATVLEMASTQRNSLAELKLGAVIFPLALQVQPNLALPGAMRSGETN
jgi:hypothetical protein